MNTNDRTAAVVLEVGTLSGCLIAWQDSRGVHTEQEPIATPERSRASTDYGRKQDAPLGMQASV